MGMEVMGPRILRNAMFLFSSFVILDSSVAVKPSSEAIQESSKMDYHEDEIVFSPDTFTTDKYSQGNVPIVNPTTPGSTPIVNPNTQTPPTTTSPPTITSPTISGPPSTTTPTTSGASWCIANPSASQTALQVALDYACGYGGTDCSVIQPNGACYDPNSVRDHASYAFNNYYQKNPIPTSCVFGGAAQLTNIDPSHGNCRFASSSSTPTTPPGKTPTIPMTPTTPTVPITPPSTTTPANPYTRGNGYGSEPTGYDYGAEPTGTPSSAGTTSVNLLLLIIMNYLILSVAVANYY